MYDHIQEDASLFDAFSTPTRLKMLVTLLYHEGTLNVQELEQKMGNVSQPTISHHIRLLRDRHLLIDHQVGLCRYYEVHPNFRQRLFDAIARLGGGHS